MHDDERNGETVEQGQLSADVLAQGGIGQNVAADLDHERFVAKGAHILGRVFQRIEWRTRCHLIQQPIKQRTLDVEAIFRLVDDAAPFSFEDFIGHFQIATHGQTMQKNRIIRR